jgi:hypothetical protein
MDTLTAFDFTPLKYKCLRADYFREVNFAAPLKRGCALEARWPLAYFRGIHSAAPLKKE